MTLNEAQFTATARELSKALVAICQLKNIDHDDAAQLIGAACAEAMAYFIGSAHAVERLRDIADIAEQDVLRVH